MSNHGGSHVIHDVLEILDRYEVFASLGEERTRTLVCDVLRVGDRYDCNPGEILDGIGERLGIRYYCRSPGRNFKHGQCEKCFAA